MRKLFWVGCILLAGTANAANNGAILSVVLDKIEYEQWDNAAAFAKHADDPIVGEILDWYALRAGRGELADYEVFMSENSDWPGLPALQAWGEGKLPVSGDPATAIKYVEHLGPQTSYGLVRLVEAHVANETTDVALEAVVENLETLEISREHMAEIQALVPALSEAEILTHIDYLLDEREDELVREYVDAELAKQEEDAELSDAWKIIEARLILVEDDGGVTAALEALPEELYNAPALAFERARYAFRQKNREAAADLMREVSTSSEALYKPELWMNSEMRTRLAGDPLWYGNPELAYTTVSNHFIDKDKSGYALAEWVSGFIALEYLDQPNVALTHFQNFKEAVGTPISLGRAGYWLGRAGDPDGYAFGAKYQTTFYGQLSAEMAGIAPDMSLINGEKPPYVGELLGHDSVHAGLLFYSADAPLLMARFFAHEAETLPPEQAEALGLLALDLDVPYAALNVGKNLAKRGVEITHSIFPIPELPTEELAVPKALTLAIMRQESEFYQRAESWVGAKGYMQLMPATAELVAGKLSLEYSEAALTDDAVYNVTLGSAYAAEVGASYDNRVLYIATGYNAGPHRVKEWIEHMGPAGPTVEDAVRWAEMIRFEETRNYAQRVLEGTYLYDAKLHGEYRLKPSELLMNSYW